METVLHGTHQRLGLQSPIQMLDPFTLHYISNLLERNIYIRYSYGYTSEWFGEYQYICRKGTFSVDRPIALGGCSDRVVLSEQDKFTVIQRVNLSGLVVIPDTLYAVFYVDGDVDGDEPLLLNFALTETDGHNAYPFETTCVKLCGGT